jgi:hypothetical protein
MLTMNDGQPRLLCERRDFLRVGSGLAVGGFTLPGILSPSLVQARPTSELAPVTGGAKSCVLVYLLGGPPHQDMFDLKPDAPSEIRGPFQPIETSVPGLQICEHLPRMAGLAKTWSLVRSPRCNNTISSSRCTCRVAGR